MTAPSSPDKGDGGNAFPVGGGDQRNAGMTMRDYFAAKALQGLMSNSEGVHAGAEPLGSWLVNSSSATAPDWLAARVYAVADAMLKERSK